MSDGVDPRAETLASATAGAEAASRTLTDPNRSRSAAPSGDDLIGAYFAHFRIERRIGQGGMGEVYLATDVALDRSVALKVLAREISDDTTARDRFVREARSQARINHPNICHIYFIGEQLGRLFFAMELVEGENLQQRIDRMGRLPRREAVDLARMAAAGLAEAQKHGFTHRDVKPSNLLLDKHGVLKVADFGLVDTVARDKDSDAVIVGTPRYMAPEQSRGEPVDFRADMYALGVTLHHLVAGSPPFAGSTVADLVAQHLRVARPRLDAGELLEALCDRLMAKRPADRFTSYEELLASMSLV